MGEPALHCLWICTEIADWQQWLAIFACYSLHGGGLSRARGAVKLAWVSQLLPKIGWRVAAYQNHQSLPFAMNEVEVDVVLLEMAFKQGLQYAPMVLWQLQLFVAILSRYRP